MAATVKVEKPLPNATVPLTFTVGGSMYTLDSFDGLRVEITDAAGMAGIIASQDADLFSNLDPDLHDVLLWKATFTLTSSQAGPVVATAIVHNGTTVLGVDTCNYIVSSTFMVKGPKTKKLELKKFKPKK